VRAVVGNAPSLDARPVLHQDAANLGGGGLLGDYQPPRPARTPPPLRGLGVTEQAPGADLLQGGGVALALQYLLLLRFNQVKALLQECLLLHTAHDLEGM
jgi:hypothetical protein